MPQECPRCGLLNPPDALRCDCGFDFPSHSLKHSYLDPARALVLQSPSLVEILISALIPFAGIYRGLRARAEGRALAGGMMMRISISVLFILVVIASAWLALSKLWLGAR